MKLRKPIQISWILGTLLTATALSVGGCQNAREVKPGERSAQTPDQAPGAPGLDQPVFESADDAFKAMLVAVKAEDHDKIHWLLGPAWKELVSGDKVEDANAFKEFTQRAAERSRLQSVNESTSIIYIGHDDWPFPIPIAKTPDGKWFFDTEAGKDEILSRRIGANELDTIAVCHAYVQAQREYSSKDRDGSGILQYAQKIQSTPGKKDGLYWHVNPGEPQSPFGPLMGDAAMEGYAQTTGHPRQPYHGYHFRILKEQESDAPGGDYDYVINDHMIAGFALVSFPAEYGSSGIMTFIVSHQGIVYQKDLGKNTTQCARSMTAYNPDSTWAMVKE